MHETNFLTITLVAAEKSSHEAQPMHVYIIHPLVTILFGTSTTGTWVMITDGDIQFRTNLPC